MKKFLVASLIGMTLILTPTAFAHAPWNHQERKLAAPVLHHLKFLRSETQKVLNEKCRSGHRIGYKRIHNMPVHLRKWARELWAGRLAKARNVKSKCVAAGYKLRVSLSTWLGIASCESGQTWNYNGSSGFDGGLQFLPSTWNAAKGLIPGASRYAYAYQAPMMVQIAVADAWLARTSWSQWPACSARLGLR